MTATEFDGGGEGYRRVLIAVSAVANSLPITLTFTALAVVVDDAGGTPLEVSLVVAAHYVGLFVFAPVWGAIADVTGRRRDVLLVTTAFATLSLFSLAFADGPWELIGVRGAYAVFVAAFAPVMLTIVSGMGGANERGKYIGEFNSARSVGFAAGQLFAGIALSRLSTTSLFFAIAAINSVILVTAGAAVDSAPKGGGHTSASEIGREIRGRLLPAAGRYDALGENGLRWLYVAVFLQSITFNGILSLLPVYLTDTVGLTEVAMGALLAMNPAGRTVFMSLFGRASDVRGRKPMIVWGLVGIGVFTLVMATATVPARLLTRGAIVGIGVLLVAAAFSAVTVGSFALIGDVAPAEREAELMGLRDTALGIGGAVGPLLFGTAVTTSGYAVGFSVWSLFSFGAAVLVAFRVLEPTYS